MVWVSDNYSLSHNTVRAEHSDTENSADISRELQNEMIVNELLSSGERRSTLHRRLHNMMEMSKIVITETIGLTRFSHVARVCQHRSNAVRWIRDVVALSHVTVECRDTSLQIFDRFLGICLAENKVLGHTDVALTAAVSVLLASKMHETRPLSMTSFPHLKTSDLIAFERLVTLKLNYSIFPLASPAAFIRDLVFVWSDGCSIKCLKHEELIETANSFVGDFFEAQEAPHFAPSTIALAALLLSFSKLGLDCTNWLEHVPNICLPCPDHPIMDTNMLLSFLDVDNCLSVFQRLQRPSATIFQAIAPQTPIISQPATVQAIISPTTVTASDMAPDVDNIGMMHNIIESKCLSSSSSRKKSRSAKNSVDVPETFYSNKKMRS